MKRLGASLLMLALIFWNCEAPTEGVHLAFKYEVGKSYKYLMTDSVRVVMDSPEGDVCGMTVLQKQNYTIAVLGKDEAQNYQLEITLEVMEDSVSYDETFPQDWRKKRKLLGRTYDYRLLMSRNGEILDVQSKDDRSVFYFEREYKGNQPFFPDKTIYPGHKWKNKVTINTGDGKPIIGITRFKFIGYEIVAGNRCAVVGFDSKLDYEKDLTDSKYNRNKYKKFSYRSSNASMGKIFFSVQDGILVHKNNEINNQLVYDFIDTTGSKLKEWRKTTDFETIKLQ